MSRFRLWFIGVLGLLALLVLAGVLAGLFGGLAGPAPAQTITSTRLAGAATATPPPYPPPRTPPLVPTAIPPSATATPVPQVTVVPGPLPPGLKIVCAEEWVDERLIVIWMANVDDLAHVQILARLPSRVPMSSLGGYISPDGRQLAYILPGKHIEEGMLGIMRIDGTNNRILDAPVFGWGTEMNLRWAPASRWIAYLRYTVSKNTETQIWLFDPGSAEKRLVTTIVPGGAVGLLGWSNDGSLLYYVAEGQLWQVNTKKEALPTELVHLEQRVSYASLSPDGEKILYLTYDDRPAAPLTLAVTSLDGKEKHVLVDNVNPSLFAFENYQLHPIWSPDSTRVLYNAMVDSRHVEMRAVQWHAPSQAATIRGKEEVYCYPVSWSPDGRFIVAFRRALGPEGRFQLSLIRLDGSVQEIYSVDPTPLLLDFVGWLGGQEGGRP